MKNIMVTVSGGRSSAMMARHIQISEKYKDYNKVFVFANTGMERYETIQFLKDIEKHWKLPLIKIEGVYSDVMGVGVSYKTVEWDELNMNAQPFSDAIMHKNKGEFDGLPNQEAPYCSDIMKTIPCKKLADSIFGVNNYVKAIGFRKEDMPKRITFAEIKEDKKRIFPLLTDFEMPIGQIELNKWWEAQPFKLGIHGKFGNCELCWKKSDSNLIDVIRYGTRFVEWWDKHEKKYANTSFRGRKSINDLVKMASSNFTPEIDFGYEDYNCVCNF
jgi:cellobiose-specific phosphotransferase system component IIB